MAYKVVFAENRDGSKFGFCYDNCQYMPFGDADNSHHLLQKKLRASNFYGAVKILKDVISLTGIGSDIFIADDVDSNDREVYGNIFASKVNNAWTIDELNAILKDELEDGFESIAVAEKDEDGRIVIRGEKRGCTEYWLVLPSMVEENIRSIARQTWSFA